MSFSKPRRVTVATTATRLDQAADPFSGGGFAVQNLGSATVFFGQADVTTATGFPILAGATLAISEASISAAYGIVASGTVEVAILQVNG